jgi:hypothetical protein
MVTVANLGSRYSTVLFSNENRPFSYFMDGFPPEVQKATDYKLPKLNGLY